MTNSPEPQAELREAVHDIVVTNMADTCDSYDETGTFTPFMARTTSDKIMQLFNNLIAEIESKIPAEFEPEMDSTGSKYITDTKEGFNMALKGFKAILATYKGKEGI